MTEIKTLGKFGLMDFLSKNISLTNASTLRGAGEDAVVLFYGDKITLVATELFLEGIHFDLTYTALHFLGYKATISVFSRIYAMNGIPRQFILSIGLSKRFSIENTEEICAGVKYACQKYKADIVDIKTTSSLTGLCLSVSCIGEGEKERVVYRHTAQPTDIICVSGNFGAAYMGLQLLEREKFAEGKEKDFKPDFAGKEYLLERQLRPEAREDIIKLLAKHQVVPTSMISVSDGLASELLHICKQSHTGCVIYENRIPIDYQTAQMAEKLNMNLTTVAVNGGEDYELLFTVPVGLYEKIYSFEDVAVIGYMSKEENELYMLTREDTYILLTSPGWTRSD